MGLLGFEPRIVGSQTCNFWVTSQPLPGKANWVLSLLKLHNRTSLQTAQPCPGQPSGSGGVRRKRRSRRRQDNGRQIQNLFLRLLTPGLWAGTRASVHSGRDTQSKAVSPQCLAAAPRERHPALPRRALGAVSEVATLSEAEEGKGEAQP